jgi:hypothetical protein
VSATPTDARTLAEWAAYMRTAIAESARERIGWEVVPHARLRQLLELVEAAPARCPGCRSRSAEPCPRCR